MTNQPDQPENMVSGYIVYETRRHVGSSQDGHYGHLTLWGPSGNSGEYGANVQKILGRSIPGGSKIRVTVDIIEEGDDWPVSRWHRDKPREHCPHCVISPRCPDGGKCHHECQYTSECWRVDNAGPLSGVYEGDKWPAFKWAEKEES